MGKSLSMDNDGGLSYSPTAKIYSLARPYTVSLAKMKNRDEGPIVLDGGMDVKATRVARKPSVDLSNESYIDMCGYGRRTEGGYTICDEDGDSCYNYATIQGWVLQSHAISACK
jgi:hypothetical protein